MHANKVKQKFYSSISECNLEILLDTLRTLEDTLVHSSSEETKEFFSHPSPSICIAFSI